MELNFDCPVIIDNFLDENSLEYVASVLSKNIWSYGWQSSNQNQRDIYWHAHFAGGDRKSRINCESDLEALELEWLKNIWIKLKENYLGDFDILRIYANGHTYGLNGSIHRDNAEFEEGYTALIYTNLNWVPAWGGETVFYNNEISEAVQSIIPKPGRLVIFHGAIPHIAKAPSRDCTFLRTTLVFKLFKKDRF